MAKSRRQPGQVPCPCRQTAKPHLHRMGRPHKNRPNLWGPCASYPRKCGRSGQVGKSSAVGSSRLRLPVLSDFPSRHSGRRRRRGGDWAAPLFLERQKYPHYPRSKQKTDAAPPKRWPPVSTSTRNRQDRVGMANQKMLCNRPRTAEIQTPRSARNRSTAPNIRVFDKNSGKSSRRASICSHS